MRMENRNIIALFLLLIVIIFGFSFYKLENSGISINYFENRIETELEKEFLQVKVSLSNSSINYSSERGIYITSENVSLISPNLIDKAILKNSIIDFKLWDIIFGNFDLAVETNLVLPNNEEYFLSVESKNNFQQINLNKIKGNNFYTIEKSNFFIEDHKINIDQNFEFALNPKNFFNDISSILNFQFPEIANGFESWAFVESSGSINSIKNLKSSFYNESNFNLKISGIYNFKKYQLKNVIIPLELEVDLNSNNNVIKIESIKSNDIKTEKIEFIFSKNSDDKYNFIKVDSFS